ncbi:MAG: hypothetical protein MJZ69_07205 [Bacteroidaceae bacterium]|nr:hypothetical protein [Bacteroidaceae bacterium]
MDYIRVGLDFGTHQTKICVQTTPGEGHGEPIYEFFQFKDLQGNKQYFLPSLIQINEDNTLSYGYVDSTREKDAVEKPVYSLNLINSADFGIAETASMLYDKYATENNNPDDMTVLAEMLKVRKQKIIVKRKIQEDQAKGEYSRKLENYHRKRNVFRYFKQATFAEREWNKKIDCKTLSIWYISYVIFLLEEKYGQTFTINMGIPADDKTFEQKKRLAVEVLLSAYNLVENVYENNMQKFLNETVDQLLVKTEYKCYSKEAKDEFIINVFPEAYAGLVTLTSRGKLPPERMSLTADIGGGTTDVSFFIIENDNPIIYRYWSIPRGLNYIAEKSGFDYAEGNFVRKANKDIIKNFNHKKMEIVSNLVKDLARQLTKETSIPTSSLYNALENRIIVYNGGGSTHPFLTEPVKPFTDVKLIDSGMWKEENIVDKAKVSPLCQLLTTAYGLSIGEKDEDVKLSMFTSLFNHLSKESESQGANYIDKDQC